MHTVIRARPTAGICIYTYTYICTYIHTNIQWSVLVQPPQLVYMCIYIYIHTYKHTVIRARPTVGIGISRSSRHSWALFRLSNWSFLLRKCTSGRFFSSSVCMRLRMHACMYVCMYAFQSHSWRRPRALFRLLNWSFLLRKCTSGRLFRVHACVDVCMCVELVLFIVEMYLRSFFFRVYACVYVCMCVLVDQFNWKMKLNSKQMYCMPLLLCACMYVCMCVCTYVCVYVHTSMVIFWRFQRASS
jgi:hypothetical protein